MRNYYLIFVINLSVIPWVFGQDCYDNIRQTAPDSRFSVNADATVTDKQTGLMWKRCLEGVSGQQCDQGQANKFNWDNARQQAQNSNFAGYDDWRLADIKELSGIAELACREPAINLNIFPHTPFDYVWSGSPLVSYPNEAWDVYFYDGSAYGSTRSNAKYVKLVREKP